MRERERESGWGGLRSRGMESLNLGPIFTAKLIKCGGRFGGDLSDLGLGFPGKSFFGESLIPQERSVGTRE